MVLSARDERWYCWYWRIKGLGKRGGVVIGGLSVREDRWWNYYLRIISWGWEVVELLSEDHQLGMGGGVIS